MALREAGLVEHVPALDIAELPEPLTERNRRRPIRAARSRREVSDVECPRGNLGDRNRRMRKDAEREHEPSEAVKRCRPLVEPHVFLLGDRQPAGPDYRANSAERQPAARA